MAQGSLQVVLAGFASKSGCLVGVSCSLERKEKVKKSGILRYRKESDGRYGGSSRDTPKKTQKKGEKLKKNRQKTQKKNEKHERTEEKHEKAGKKLKQRGEKLKIKRTKFSKKFVKT